MKILVACEFTGRVREAFKALGHDAWSCDLLQTEIPGQHIQGDVFKILGEAWDALCAFPPCTYLCSSGARWWIQRRREQLAAINFVQKLACATWIPKIAIENPVGILSRPWPQGLGKPSQIIQPWQFGHPETKTTCLWLKGFNPLKPTNIVTPEFARLKDGSLYLDKRGRKSSRLHFLSGSMKDRQKDRSRTYPGIASAMAAQWGG